MILTGRKRNRRVLLETPPPPPPPKRPNMRVNVNHCLISRETIDIYLHGWKVKLDNGSYAKYWLTEDSQHITPAYISPQFDVLGRRLEAGFLEEEEYGGVCFDDLLSASDPWFGSYTPPPQDSLYLPPLLNLNEISAPSPPPPPPPPITSPLEPICDDLDKSQYSPSPSDAEPEDMEICNDAMDISPVKSDVSPMKDNISEQIKQAGAVLQSDSLNELCSPSNPTRDSLRIAWGDEMYSSTWPTKDLVTTARQRSSSGSDYQSADEYFPPPAPSPPSLPPGSPLICSPPPPPPPNSNTTLTTPLNTTLTTPLNTTLTTPLNTTLTTPLNTTLTTPLNTTLTNPTDSRDDTIKPSSPTVTDPVLSTEATASATSLQSLSTIVSTPCSLSTTPGIESKTPTLPTITPTLPTKTPTLPTTTPELSTKESATPGALISGRPLTLPALTEVEKEGEVGRRLSLKRPLEQVQTTLKSRLGSPHSNTPRSTPRNTPRSTPRKILPLSLSPEVKDEEKHRDTGIEDIDSPDELEDDKDDPDLPSSLSTFREVMTDTGVLKRVLIFRKSKFRATGTPFHHLSKMSSKMDYEDACARNGLPLVVNKGNRPVNLGRALSDRIENPKKKLPLKRGGFSGVPLASLTRSFRVQQHDPPPGGRTFGIPIRRIRQPSGSCLTRTLTNSALHQNTHQMSLTRMEQLMSNFCGCWVERPFHDANCATTHDNFVEGVLERNNVRYPVVKECIREYSSRVNPFETNPVKKLNLFKSILNSKT